MRITCYYIIYIDEVCVRTGPHIHDLCLSVLHRHVYVGETLGWRVYVDPHGLLRPEVFSAERGTRRARTAADYTVSRASKTRLQLFFVGGTSILPLFLP